MNALSLTLKSQVLASTPSYDEDAIAYFAVRDTYGTALTTQQKTDINAFFVTAKADDFLFKLDLLLLCDGNTDSTANLINAVNPAQILTPSGGITYNNSIVGNGTDAYVDTGISASGKNFIAANLTGTAISVAAKDVFGAGYTDVDTNDIYSKLSFWNKTTGNRSTSVFTRSNNLGSLISVSPSLVSPPSYNTAGLVVGNIATVYLTGASSVNSSSQTFPDVLANYYLLGVNLNGSPDSFASSVISSAAIGTGFTATDTTSYLAAMTTFQTAKTTW